MHVHNVKDQEVVSNDATRPSWGYRRENGRVGIRNHVIILPLDDLSNAACEAVANNIKGTLALPHHYGRLQFGADLELHFRTLIGTGCNPNVAAVVVIGIEPEWTKFGSPTASRARQASRCRVLRYRAERRFRDHPQGLIAQGQGVRALGNRKDPQKEPCPSQRVVGFDEVR